MVRTRLELLDVFRRNLGNLKQTYLAIVVNKSTTLSAATPLIWSSLEQGYITLTSALVLSVTSMINSA